MSEMDIDTDTLRQGADDLTAATDEVSAVFEVFQAAVQSYPDAFGGDEIGMLLGLAHEGCVEAVAECFTTNIEDLEDYAESLHGMADSYQQVEDDTLALFSKFEVD